MKKAWIRFTVLLILAILFLSFALFAGVLAPFDPLESHYADMLKAPNSTYIFGTDQLGRDLFSRILYGGKSSLLIAFTVTAIISSVGILVGTIAGFTGGIFDNLLMRFSDMLMAFPGYIFTIALVSFIGVGLPNMILAMSLTGWTYYARISRSLVLSVKNNVYIEQARLGGASNWKILLHYIIPNVLPSLLVNIFQDIGGELLTISGLSLLGLGSPPPTPEWGFMLSEGKDYMYSAPWMLLFPGMVILNPCDHYEMQAAVRAAVEHKGPCYIRLGRLAVESINNNDDYKFELGKGITLREGTDITVVATGLMVQEAVKAADALKEEGISVEVINIHTIKPLDEELVIASAKKTGRVITVEEHNIIGGLGEAVSTALSEHCPTPVTRIGVNDVYGHSGPAVDLLKEFGLSAEHIAEVIREKLAK